MSIHHLLLNVYLIYILVSVIYLSSSEFIRTVHIMNERVVLFFLLISKVHIWGHSHENFRAFSDIICRSFLNISIVSRSIFISALSNPSLVKCGAKRILSNWCPLQKWVPLSSFHRCYLWVERWYLLSGSFCQLGALVHDFFQVFQRISSLFYSWQFFPFRLW
jgi:hypothetical protein